MAVGDKIVVATGNKASQKIREMGSKWGVSVSPKTFVVGDVVLGADPNNMYNWLVAAKNKSQWTGTVPTSLKVSTGQLITDVFNIAYTTAEQIRAYCACNCNHCSCNCDRCSYCNDCCTDGSDGNR